jgi:hypothetical protein
LPFVAGILPGILTCLIEKLLGHRGLFGIIRGARSVAVANFGMAIDPSIVPVSTERYRLIDI